MFTHQSNFFIHFNELKVRTFYFLISFISTFFISYLYRIEIFYSISKLFLQHERGFIYTGVLDPFFVYIQLSLFISFVFTFIFSIYIYGFYFFKSFYNRIGRFFFLMIISYYSWVILFYWIWYNFIFRIFFHFFLSYQRLNLNEVMIVSLEATLDRYLYLFFYFIFIYFIIIYIPFILFFIVIYFNNENNLKSIKLRKYLYIFILFIFLFIAPPDLLMQLIFLPIIILFFEIFIYLITFYFVLYNKLR